MAGSENFNDGASLASKGWRVIGVVANTVGAGPDGSYALKLSDPAYMQGAVMPLESCADGSAGLTLTFDWQFEHQTVGSGPTWIALFNRSFGTTEENPYFYIQFETLAGNARVANVGQFNVVAPAMFPPVSTDWHTVEVDLVWSTSYNAGTALGSPDGSVTVTIDDLVVFSRTGTPLVHRRMVDPATYPLPFDGVDLHPQGAMDNIGWNDHCTGEGGGSPGEGGEVIDRSDICSCTGLDPDTADAGGGQGHGASPIQYPSIGAQIACVGGGLVPTQADILVSEVWWGN
jgi:hypothetical protein